jgi:hypothetical protein
MLCPTEENKSSKRELGHWGNSCFCGDNYVSVTSSKKYVLIYIGENIASMIYEVIKKYAFSGLLQGVIQMFTYSCKFWLNIFSPNAVVNFIVKENLLENFKKW